MMTTDHRTIVSNLKQCTFLPGSWDKRFIRNLDLEKELSVKQLEQVIRLLYKYRRQVPEVYERFKKLCPK